MQTRYTPVCTYSCKLTCISVHIHVHVQRVRVCMTSKIEQIHIHRDAKPSRQTDYIPNYERNQRDLRQHKHWNIFPRMCTTVCTIACILNHYMCMGGRGDDCVRRSSSQTVVICAVTVPCAVSYEYATLSPFPPFLKALVLVLSSRRGHGGAKVSTVMIDMWSILWR